MNDIRTYIERWIEEMLSKYPSIKFVYEIYKDGRGHKICVYPKELINSSEDYCNDEINFSFTLDRLFPNNGVLFSTEEDIFSCSNKAKVYANRVMNVDTPSNLKYKANGVYNNEILDDCSYSLAA